MAYELKRYDESQAIPACGFVNMGATCYFNAMLQSLLGCTSFNQIIMDERKKNSLTAAYAAMLDDIKAGSAVVQDWAPKIWTAFADELKLQGRRTALGSSSSRQEDSQEALTLFIECCQSRAVDRLFEHRYRLITKCLSCGYKSPARIDEGMAIEVSIKELGGASLFDHICRHAPDMSKDDSYTCPECKIKGKGTKEQVRYLSMLPEVMIIQFKKYEDLKWEVPFPEVMRFPMTDGARVYRLVSQTEHSGGREGGHYWARSLRRGGVYTLNDTSVGLSQWKSTPNTYMAWYHIT